MCFRGRGAQISSISAASWTVRSCKQRIGYAQSHFAHGVYRTQQTSVVPHICRVIWQQDKTHVEVAMWECHVVLGSFAVSCILHIKHCSGQVPFCCRSTHMQFVQSSYSITLRLSQIAVNRSFQHTTYIYTNARGKGVLKKTQSLVQKEQTIC